MAAEKEFPHAVIVEVLPVVFRLRKPVGDHVDHERIDAEAEMARRRFDVLNKVVPVLAVLDRAAPGDDPVAF